MVRICEVEIYLYQPIMSDVVSILLQKVHERSIKVGRIIIHKNSFDFPQNVMSMIAHTYPLAFTTFTCKHKSMNSSQP